VKLLVSKWFVKQKVVFCMASIVAADLTVLKELIEAKTVTPVVDRRYEFREAAEALRYLKEGHARGKVVIAMEHNSRRPEE
jgi:NADPH:quinone reductase-like Zn-dependent oxidoreductase